MQTTSEHAQLVGSDPIVPWYALYTRHQHEKTAADLLTGKGFQVFLPLYQATHRWKDRTKLLSLPFFPSYVFIKGGLDRQLQIMTTPGIYTFVNVAGRAATITDAEIGVVRRMVESSLRVEPHPFLKGGDRVRVTCGPLEGIEGILIRKKNFVRLVLSVELLMKSVAVEVDEWMVKRLDGGKVAAAPANMKGGLALANGHYQPQHSGRWLNP
ncbi:MAG: transcription termination/antitermination protein NusG [Terriglobia bacterium]